MTCNLEVGTKNDQRCLKWVGWAAYRDWDANLKQYGISLSTSLSVRLAVSVKVKSGLRDDPNATKMQSQNRKTHTEGIYIKHYQTDERSLENGIKTGDCTLGGLSKGAPLSHCC